MNKATTNLIISDEFSRRSVPAIQKDLMDLFPEASFSATAVLAFRLEETIREATRLVALNRFLYGS